MQSNAPNRYGQATFACQTGKLLVIVGVELKACVEANRLVITRPDGKQYKPTITRRERDQTASP